MTTAKSAIAGVSKACRYRTQFGRVELAHWIGDGFDALKFEDLLVYPLNFIGHYDPAIEDAGLVDAALFSWRPVAGN